MLGPSAGRQVRVDLESKARGVRAAAGAALATGGAEPPTEIPGEPPRREGWAASSKALAGRRLRHAWATIMVRPQRTKD